MTNRAARFAALIAFLAVAVVSAGCLVKETSHTLCLEPDGSVRWAVLERNIHATADTPADRQREEDEFMASVGAGMHGIAVAFRALGASDVSTQLVSAEWPYAVRTEARFPDIARLWQQCLDSVDGVRAQSTLEVNGNRTTWRVTVDLDPDVQRPDSDVTQAIESLFDDNADAPLLFIRHGQFVDAVGFEIADDGRVAKLKDVSEDWDKDPHLRLSLTWVGTEATNAARK